MNNPLIQHVNSMPVNNSIFNIARMLRNGNPSQIAMTLIKQNPQFKAFIETNKGKTPEMVARENGIDISKIRNMI